MYIFERFFCKRSFPCCLSVTVVCDCCAATWVDVGLRNRVDVSDHRKIKKTKRISTEAKVLQTQVPWAEASVLLKWRDVTTGGWEAAIQWQNFPSRMGTVTSWCQLTPFLINITAVNAIASLLQAPAAQPEPMTQMDVQHEKVEMSAII